MKKAWDFYRCTLFSDPLIHDNRYFIISIYRGGGVQGLEIGPQITL